jgi:hypothetical protein
MKQKIEKKNNIIIKGITIKLATTDKFYLETFFFSFVALSSRFFFGQGMATIFNNRLS